MNHLILRVFRQFKQYINQQQLMAQTLEELKTHLAVVKQSPQDKIDQDFYNFMLKAKDALGQSSYPMAQFYYEYAHYILTKIQSNLDIFNDQAIPDNVHQEEEEIVDDAAQQFGESQSPQQEANPEAPEAAQGNIQGQEAAPPNLNDQPQIIEGENIEQNSGQKGVEQAKNEEQEDMEDRQICFLNLRMAQNLYEEELSKIKTGQSNTNIEQVLDGLKRTLTRLGDSYMLDQDYNKCIECYQKVIDQESTREGFECNRLVSQLYFLIGNSYLYQNQADCQIKAISEYIKSVNILLSYLSLTLGYDISAFEIPSEQKTKVERFNYMCLAGDSQEVKEIKDILGSMLDKIEDTHSQIPIKEAYMAEKKKIEEENKKSQFKPVQDSSKVKYLGNFGNRKKKPEDEEKVASPSGKIEQKNQIKDNNSKTASKNQENN